MTAVLYKFNKRKEIDEDYYDLIDKLDYYQVLLLDYVNLNKKNEGHILSGISSAFDKDSNKNRDDFLSFLNNPNFVNWCNIRKKLIDGTTTSWQLWLRHREDSSLYKEEYSQKSFPTADSFLKHLKTHKEHRILAIEEIIDETLLKIEKYTIWLQCSKYFAIIIDTLIL